METKTVKIISIFVASSAELSDDRKAFGNFVNKLNLHYEDRGFNLKPILWEYLEIDDHKQRKQNEYNQHIKECDVFISLFHTKVGPLTEEEFKVALQENQNPKHKLPMLTFMRELVNGEKIKRSLREFRKTYFENKGNEYFWSSYENIQELQLDFTLWLDKFLLSNSTFSVKDGIISLGEVEVAIMEELPFVAKNEEYMRMNNDLKNFPSIISKYKKTAESVPSDQELLEKTINEYNELKTTLEKYQQQILETAILLAENHKDQKNPHNKEYKQIIETFTVKDVTFNMVCIEGGTYIMGEGVKIDINGDPQPEHPVTLTNYWIGEIPVTQALWYAVMGERPSKWVEKQNPQKTKDYPVECVSWDDCNKFIHQLNNLLKNKLNAMGLLFRFPTEAEWEYAARGGAKTHSYLFSGSNNIYDVAWFTMNSNTTQPVKCKKPNELGLYDMTGNVFEWCQDSFYNYQESKKPEQDPVCNDSGSYKICRGGSYKTSENMCKVTYRHVFKANGSQEWNLGIRLAL